MTSGSTFARRRAVANEARRQRAEISDGKEPGSAPRKIRRSRSTVAMIVAATRAVVFNTRAGGDLFMIRPCVYLHCLSENGGCRAASSLAAGRADQEYNRINVALQFTVANKVHNMGSARSNRPAAPAEARQGRSSGGKKYRKRR